MTTDTRIETGTATTQRCASGARNSPPWPRSGEGLLRPEPWRGDDEHLDAKTRELIAIAVAVTTRCEGCIDAHVRKAKAAGATKEEVAETLGVAIALNAGAAFTYSLHVLDAMDGAGS